MDKQAKEAKKLVKQMTFTQKIKHFWDYYKIHTIVTLVVLMLIGVTVYQVVSNKEYDLPIEFFGEKMITDEQAAALESYLKDYVDDIDGDGKVTVHLTRTGSLSQMGAAGYGSIKFTAELAAGQYQIFILDEDLYNSLKSGNSGEDEMLIESFDMRENAKCAEILGMTADDEPTYWCLLKMPEKMNEKPENQGKIQNAEKATAAMKQ